MNSREIRNLFLEFFKKKGHAVVPSSSLISDDPSVLFTTAGMQQFKPYYLGEKSPYGENAVSIQKCFRTSDIDSVGDESHLTFFEMLGNFSFAASAEASGEGGAGYFKEKAIEYAYEFLAKELKLKIGYVSVFGGDGENNIPPDEESEKIWKKIDDRIEIKKAGKKDNFWGPTGDEGPCGPTTEIYINGVEIWNIVFNEYYKDKDGKFTKLKTPGVDTGMGLERLAMVAQNKPTIFETDLFSSFINIIPDGIPNQVRRLVADHMRGTAFLLSDGVRPSNKEAGYVLRRIMRRTIMHANQIGIELPAILSVIVKEYKKIYPELNDLLVQEEFKREQERFEKTLKIGYREFKKMENVDAASAFKLYETYGLPFEVLKDFGGKRTECLKREDFDEEFKKHQEISRAGLEKKFGGHGLKEGGLHHAVGGFRPAEGGLHHAVGGFRPAEGGETIGASEEEEQKLTRLHTATHLLHQALTDLFGNEMKQMGSDINPERLRFDFPFDRKLTAEEIVKLETIVNQKIKENLPVKFEEKSKEEAMAEGAKAFFKAKYPDRVKVYSIGPSANSGQAYSKEICNGPHVKNTAEIGRFKIVKEEAVSADVRRIKAVIEETPNKLS